MDPNALRGKLVVKVGIDHAKLCKLFDPPTHPATTTGPGFQCPQYRVKGSASGHRSATGSMRAVADQYQAAHWKPGTAAPRGLVDTVERK